MSEAKNGNHTRTKDVHNVEKEHETTGKRSFSGPIEYFSSPINNNLKKVQSYACTHVCHRVCLKWRVYIPLAASFLEDVPLVEFMYLVFTRMTGGVTLRDSGLCCCVPCLSSAIISFCLLALLKSWLMFCGCPRLALPYANAGCVARQCLTEGRV